MAGYGLDKRIDYQWIYRGIINYWQSNAFLMYGLSSPITVVPNRISLDSC